MMFLKPLNLSTFVVQLFIMKSFCFTFEKTNTMKKVLVLGASTNEERISNTAIHRLRKHGYEVEAVGLKTGMVADVEIKTGMPIVENIDTVTMYVGAKNQPQFYDYIINLQPRRVIFNPGSENDEFEKMLQQKNIEVEEACTLVLLGTGQF
jgi:uncharacterized protein